MKIIKIKKFSDIPNNFTGIAKTFDGTKIWFKNGKIHRKNRPAEEWYDGYRVWYKNGKIHREEGPATYYKYGYQFYKKMLVTEYWLNDICLTKEQHKIIMIFSKNSREKLYENNNRGLKNLLALK